MRACVCMHACVRACVAWRGVAWRGVVCVCVWVCGGGVWCGVMWRGVVCVRACVCVGGIVFLKKFFFNLHSLKVLEVVVVDRLALSLL